MNIPSVKMWQASNVFTHTVIIIGLLHLSSFETIKLKRPSNLKTELVQSLLSSFYNVNIALHIQKHHLFNTHLDSGNTVVSGELWKRKLMLEVCHKNYHNNIKFTYILVSFYRSGHKHLARGINTIRKCDLF